MSIHHRHHQGDDDSDQGEYDEENSVDHQGDDTDESVDDHQGEYDHNDDVGEDDDCGNDISGSIGKDNGRWDTGDVDHVEATGTCWTGSDNANAAGSEDEAALAPDSELANKSSFVCNPT